MPRSCTVCQHGSRRQIDIELAAGGPIQRIAKTFGVGESAVRRHRDNHLAARLIKAAEANDMLDATAILRHLVALHQTAHSLIGDAKAVADFRAAVGAIRETRETLLAVAKLLADAGDKPAEALRAEMEATHAAVDAALSDYPEARAAVAARLADLEETA